MKATLAEANTKGKPYAAVVENAVATSTEHVGINPSANCNPPWQPECVIEQELSLDDNIELLQSPSLSVNFQETGTNIEMLKLFALCFHFFIHLLQPTVK